MSHSASFLCETVLSFTRARGQDRELERPELPLLRASFWQALFWALDIPELVLNLGLIL